MSEPKSIGVGIVGLGFMGRTHLASYLAANETGCPNRIVALCDRDEARRAGRPAEGGNVEVPVAGLEEFDPTSVPIHADLDALLAEDGVDLVSICTHTDSHVDYAIRALEAGKHVVVEKPVALASSEVERLAAAVASTGRLCLPAMVMRFSPDWRWLRERIRDGRFGAVRSATFRRLGSPPAWAREFYSDLSRSGGALFDLHVHDADFVQWCFGTPEAVTTTGTLHHLTTLYHWSDGPPHVAVEGGWDHTPGLDFRMLFTVVFEQATADYDLRRSPQLWLARDGKFEPVDPEETGRGDGYELEIRHALECVAAGRTDTDATVAEAAELTRVLEAERESLESGRRVEVSRTAGRD